MMQKNNRGAVRICQEIYRFI